MIQKPNTKIIRKGGRQHGRFKRLGYFPGQFKSSSAAPGTSYFLVIIPYRTRKIIKEKYYVP
jgi:hypothetical protein